MSGGQPTIKVEHFHRQKSPSVPEADYRRRNSASPPSLRVTQMVGRRSSYVLCEDEVRFKTWISYFKYCILSSLKMTIFGFYKTISSLFDQPW